MFITVMNKEIRKWWESHRMIFNIYTVITGVICLVLMTFFNSAAVSFFMLPFVILYLLCLNVMYTLFYIMFCRHATGDCSSLKAKAFNKIVSCAVLANVLL